MIRAPRFTEDLAHLPTHKFGTSSLTWWGVMAFMVIEGAAFGMAFAAYFYFMGHAPTWPPEGHHPPGLIAGTLFTIIILLSETPNSMIKKAALHANVARMRQLMPVMVGVGVVLLVIRGFEFDSLNVLWTDNAYGSIVWALLVLHTTHILTDWFDTVVLWVLMRTNLGHDPRHFEDVDENAIYWRYVWLLWIPIYFMIYWVPRL
jgi:cytochrome c oxidase subunit III